MTTEEMSALEKDLLAFLSEPQELKVHEEVGGGVNFEYQGVRVRIRPAVIVVGDEKFIVPRANTSKLVTLAKRTASRPMPEAKTRGRVEAARGLDGIVGRQKKTGD